MRDATGNSRSRWYGRSALAAAVVTAALMLTGLSSGATPPGTWVRTTFPGWGLTLSHPPTWRSYPYVIPTENALATVGFLSTEPVPPPRRDLVLPHFTGDGVLLELVKDDSPRRPATGRLPGRPAELGGHAARIRITQESKFCSAGKATVMLVSIAGSADPGSRQDWWIAACFGPVNTRVDEAAVLRALQTMTFRR